MVMFEVMSCVHPLSGMAMLGDDSLWMVDMVCLVLVKRRVFLVGVPPGSVGDSNRTVLHAMTGMCGSSESDALCVPTVGCNVTTVVATLGATKLVKGKCETTKLLLEVNLW